MLIHKFSVLSLQLKKLRRHNKSAIDLSNTSPGRGHKEVRRSTAHIMVTARYSNQQDSKSRQNPCQVEPTENIRNVSASRRCLWVRTTISTVVSGVLPVYQNLEITSYKEDCLMCRLSNKVTKNDAKSFYNSFRRVTPRQVKRHFTSNGTDQCHNGSSNLLIPYREQPRSTWIVVAYPRPEFSATKRTNHAPINFDQQTQVSQGHTYYRKKEN